MKKIEGDNEREIHRFSFKGVPFVQAEWKEKEKKLN